MTWREERGKATPPVCSCGGHSVGTAEKNHLHSLSTYQHTLQRDTLIIGLVWVGASPFQFARLLSVHSGLSLQNCELLCDVVHVAV